MEPAEPAPASPAVRVVGTQGDIMDYRRLGRSGLKVSEFSFGAWVTFGKQVGEDDAASMMAAAYDSGINFFDNAEGYERGNAELVMGEALSRLGWGRDTYAVSSKVFWGGDGPLNRGLSRKHVTDAAHAALKRLRVDYLDLYFCHRPDLDTPIEETVWAMHNLITQGKVLYWGTSEWTSQQLTEAYAAARQYNLTPPTMEQPEYNLFTRQKVESDYLPLYDLFGLGTTIWSPLASGLLTGKYKQGIPKGSRLATPGLEWLRDIVTGPVAARRLAAVQKLAKIASELDTTLPRLALAWCLKNPHVSTVILGASKVAQLRENLGALEVVAQLTPAVMTRLDRISQPAAD